MVYLPDPIVNLTHSQNPLNNAHKKYIYNYFKAIDMLYLDIRYGLLVKHMSLMCGQNNNWSVMRSARK